MNLLAIAPETALVTLALVIILLDLVLRNKTTLATVAMVGLVVPIGLTLALWNQQGSFLDALAVDPFSLFFKLFFLGIALLSLLAAVEYSDRFPRYRGEFFALMLTAVAGMMLLSSATELMTTFISLELMSISFYGLAGFLKDQKSTEASVKYLLLGALSSGVLLYGMALFYGLTGQTTYRAIAQQLGLPQAPDRAVLLLALALVIAGFGFKVSAVPFQMWTPDVYEGAPTPITALLSVGSKAAAFAAVLRFFWLALPPDFPIDWTVLWVALAVITMLFGNIAALVQTNIKRMLAYSSIGQAGYMLLGLAVPTEFGRSAVIFYLLAYALTNLGAFAAVIAISNRTNSDEISSYNGMARRAPFLAAALTLCLISLTGLPPTAGFFAKFYLFSAAVQVGLAWVVVIAVLTSAISAYFYLRVVRAMYLLPAEEESPVAAAAPTLAAVAVATAGVVIVFLLANPLIGLSDIASRTLGP
ncbi:MAG: NAD(P)H-quinone oxidoreductase subunit 2 [Dehalococcoidia bacterium]|nr:MAG: NAD(P)H-quinone oxidoreductase subunit 2 [Dehalococcoidia bacterium]